MKIINRAENSSVWVRDFMDELHRFFSMKPLALLGGATALFNKSGAMFRCMAHGVPGVLPASFRGARLYFFIYIIRWIKVYFVNNANV